MIAVSFLTSKLNRKETIKRIDESNADLIHVDLMDGIYVEKNNFVLNEIIEDLSNTKKKLDIHLMVVDPLKYIKELINLNVYMITIHLDGTNNTLEVINFVKNNNVKIGIAINPKEDVSILNDYIDLIDYVLIMSVEPGLGGQKFIPDVLEKINVLKDRNILVGIDGGINDESIKYLKEYKIDIIISGSYICMSDDYNKQIEELKVNLMSS